MARIEWVRLRLNNWALWRARDTGGGRGWSTQASFLSIANTSTRYREAVIPIDDCDAAITNTAVESLKKERGHLYTTLQCIYPQGLGVKETARRCCLAESTIKAHLDQADAALAQWFRDRADAKKSSAT